MGIYDRDYYRTPSRGGFADLRPWSVTTCLIVINVIVFFADGMLQRLQNAPPLDDSFPVFAHQRPQSIIYDLGYFSLNKAVMQGQVWRFITYQFLHASPMHIIFNMIGLYMFGPIVEGQLGARRYLGFYISCGIAGALMYVLLWSVHILSDMTMNAQMIGASGCIFGVLLAAAKLVPDYTIQLIFPPIALTLRVLAWVYVGIAIWTVMTAGGNAGGEASHLGGAFWGYLLIRNEHWMNFLVPSRKSSGMRPVRRRKVAFRDWTRDDNH